MYAPEWPPKYTIVIVSIQGKSKLIFDLMGYNIIDKLNPNIHPSFGYEQQNVREEFRLPNLKKNKSIVRNIYMVWWSPGVDVVSLFDRKAAVQSIPSDKASFHILTLDKKREGDWRIQKCTKKKRCMEMQDHCGSWMKFRAVV